MAVGDRIDPVKGYNFTISLVDSASTAATIQLTVGLPPQGGFSECSGIELTMQPEEYREGGNNGTVLKFTSRASWTNLRLKRGVVTSPDLWQWHSDFLDGHGKRRDGVITLMDDLGNGIRSWRFTRGLPVKWTGPSLNAMQAQVAVEEIEIAHEGLRQSGSSSLFGAIGSLF